MEADARNQVVERWGDMVWRLAVARSGNIHDAEDIFQEVFLRFFKNEHKLASDEHKKAWLIRCTINRTKSLAVSSWRQKIRLFENGDEVRKAKFSEEGKGRNGGRSGKALEIAAEAGVSDEYREVYDAVLSLPVKYRTVIHLYYYEEMPVAEIAVALECAEGTVKSQLARGREMLRGVLKEDLEI